MRCVVGYKLKWQLLVIVINTQFTSINVTSASVIVTVNDSLAFAFNDGGSNPEGLHAGLLDVNGRSFRRYIATGDEMTRRIARKYCMIERR